jgi:putative molybdopterin biosynthesis protein
MSQKTAEYLTTKELAELLRITERKVYDLAASGQVPCSRAMGKLLFPRREIDSWLARGRTGSAGAPAMRRENVLLGSHEPLLEWSLRESACGLATLLDGSVDGLDRFERGEGVASGLHLPDAAGDGWNTGSVRERFAQQPVALLEFAWRARGLIVAPGRESELADITALEGRRVVPRQKAAGSQVLLERLMTEAGLATDAVVWTDTARTESDAALAVLEGKAEAALGLGAVADQLRLGFVPVVRERFDILVDRRAWFEPSLQRLFNFFSSDKFQTRARQMAGYDTDGLGKVRFNGG